MKLLAALLIGLPILGGLVFWAVFVWLHHTYTVGMDLNLKAIAVAGVALLVLASTVFAIVFLVRRRSL
jgi:heme/copper-type cytochrome/quinol oxidase subunit 1